MVPPYQGLEEVGMGTTLGFPGPLSVSTWGCLEPLSSKNLTPRACSFWSTRCDKNGKGEDAHDTAVPGLGENWNGFGRRIVCFLFSKDEHSTREWRGGLLFPEATCVRAHRALGTASLSKLP